MNTVEILKGAKALIETKGWVQEAFAMDAHGQHCDDAADATCFCMMGAVSVAAGGNPESGAGGGAAEALMEALGQGKSLLFVVDWNDEEGRTVSEVLAKFDEAIAAEEAKLTA